MGEPSELDQKFDSLRFNQVPLTTFDTLPDDILVGIFGFLNLRDQTRLAACCSRFHSINQSKVAKKLDAVVAFWGERHQYVNTYESYMALKKARCWNRQPTDDYELTIDESFFAHGQTNTLEIKVKPNHDRPYLLLSHLFKTLQYASLDIYFADSERNNALLFRSLISGRKLKDCSLTIKFGRAMFEDIGSTRELLLELPTMKCLQLNWVYWGINSDSLETEVITDGILLYLVDHSTEELIVGEGDCSLQGLLHVHHKLIVSECKHVEVTVRREVAQEFVQKIMRHSYETVQVHQGKLSQHEGNGIAMSRLIITKRQYDINYEFL
ncbi:hypothetical protein PENTCL1PPCAC_10245 [Pristionchus entomophagus]|uniref:F-box domain-containing protein n=1 Tax=Pristionchus entomophagus TaxID=358040 RepID=A0AAV5SY27_9BILA|nr:hypothetical protein PENTCL1PPCAC_10245 [Pristionchus entomophagus]